MISLSNVRIVLIETTHPGNIGAVARAMKNMCLRQLYLVRSQVFPSAEATARASGADDVLAGAVVCDSLEAALADCRLVVGASARLRSVRWPQLEPRCCAQRLLQEAAAGPVALVFGREHSGLSNEELDRCHYLVHIPANPDYSSLNLSMAVQVLAYELHMAARPAPEAEDDSPAMAASVDAMEGFYAHLDQALMDIGFSDAQRSTKLMRRLRRLFNRARPQREELNILRGILSAAQGRKSMRR